MDSECKDWLFGDLFTKNGTTMEELIAYIQPIMQEDSNEMNPNGTTVNLDDGGVSVSPVETDTSLDNRPELCEASYTTVRNESSEFVTENRLPLIVSMGSSINDFLVELNPIKCLPDTPESSSAAVQRHSGRHADNIPDPRYGTVRVPWALMQTSSVSVLHNFNTMQSSLSSLEQRHSVRSADNSPDPRYGMVRVPPVVMQSSSVPVQQNFNIIAPRYIPSQRNPANVLEGERNFGGPIQPQHLEEQYYLPVMMQLPSGQHFPAQWNPNHFHGGGNFWPVRSRSTEMPYYPVTTQMFPGQFDHLPPPPL